ncbi:MAG: hypothetical protein JRF23_01550 [Deltaproteobacteria bacterium]|nr:hypothetical protein [Deltaproteobacteria bacterium]
MRQGGISWKAIFKPGEAEDFFSPAPPGDFDPSAEGFSPVNAWWLSEMARLVYRRDEAARRRQKPTRGEILARFGLTERATFRDGNLFAALFQSVRQTVDPFAVLVFRGSSGHLDNWMANLSATARPWSTGGKVHGGFKQALLGFWLQILEALCRIEVPVFYTGHSLGAALATLAASLRPPRALYTFGSPRVGDRRFGRTLDRLPVFRIANPLDIVTDLPPTGWRSGFRHVGERHVLPVARDRSPRPVSGARFPPPVFLAEHAPICYTLGLKRVLNPSG